MLRTFFKVGESRRNVRCLGRPQHGERRFRVGAERGEDGEVQRKGQRQAARRGEGQFRTTGGDQRRGGLAEEGAAFERQGKGVGSARRSP